jgi:hypothetical protein
MRAAAMSLLLACGGGGPQGPDTSCPPSGSSVAALRAEIATRGLVAPPDTATFEVAGGRVMVAWKNLLSGRALTLSCAYRARDAEWVLLRRRLDEGTYALRVSVTAEPPALVYRDVDGRVLETLLVERER